MKTNSFITKILSTALIIGGFALLICAGSIWDTSDALVYFLTAGSMAGGSVLCFWLWSKLNPRKIAKVVAKIQKAYDELDN